MRCRCFCCSGIASRLRRRTPAPRPSPGGALRELLGNGSFILLVLYFTLPALAGWVVRDWMPAILKAEFGIGQGQAGVSATLYWQTAAIVGAVAGGWLADRWMRRRRARADLTSARSAWRSSCRRCSASATRRRPASSRWRSRFLFVFGLGWGFFDSNNMPILCQIARPELRATGYGIMNLVSISCGGFADWGFGVLRDRHVPLFGIFGIFASAAIVSIVLVLLIRPRVRRSASRRDRARQPGPASASDDDDDPMKLTRPLHELVPAVHSPFRDDGAIAPEVVAVQAAFLAANGIRTVFVTGSTGECHSLTSDERLALYDAWANAGPANGFAVIAHVGGNSIEDARRLARRARTCGCAAISALAPSYYKPRQSRIWSTGARRLPTPRPTCRSTTTTFPR